MTGKGPLIAARPSPENSVGRALCLRKLSALLKYKFHYFLAQPLNLEQEILFPLRHPSHQIHDQARSCWSALLFVYLFVLENPFCLASFVWGNGSGLVCKPHDFQCENML